MPDLGGRKHVVAALEVALQAADDRLGVRADDRGIGANSFRKSGPSAGSATTATAGANTQVIPVARTARAVAWPMRVISAGSCAAPSPMLCGNIVAP